LLEIVLPALHPAQQQIFNCTSRFIVVNAGRRFGKTLICSLLAVVTMLDGGRVWWLAPTYAIGAEGWASLEDLIENIPGISVRLGVKTITHIGGGSIQLRSTDDPAKLRGAGLDLAIFDEFSFTQKPQDVWQKSIRPALADRQGRALFISTPNGRNYFWKLHKKAKNTAEKDWAYFEFPTASNPFILSQEIADAKAELPQDVFDQEFLAKFVESHRGIFRTKPAIRENILETVPDPDCVYSIGVDFGKVKDFSVYTVYNLSRNSVAYIERFNQLEYKIQIERLKFVYEIYKPKVMWVERNNVGEVLVSQLRDIFGDRLVKEYVATNREKRNLIEHLIVGFEREWVKIPNDKELLDELNAFKILRTKTGKITYAAPYGVHDDMVISLALAYYENKPKRRYQTAKVFDNPFYG